MSGSEFILAINNDPDAPIFKIADVGIKGDIKNVIPSLLQAL
jgi:electron transfer flavoprotein alpha subunit